MNHSVKTTCASEIAACSPSPRSLGSLSPVLSLAQLNATLKASCAMSETLVRHIVLIKYKEGTDKAAASAAIAKALLG